MKLMRFVTKQNIGGTMLLIPLVGVTCAGFYRAYLDDPTGFFIVIGTMVYFGIAIYLFAKRD